MSKVDISIIIVSYNTRELTIECVNSITRGVKENTYQIIVVDNASSDDSVLELSKIQNKNLIVIENPDNFGFSKANNIGAKVSTGRYVLFLNSDTVVYEKTIDGMIKFMDENPNVGASTCFLRMPNGKLDDASHRGFPTPLRSFFHFSNISKLFPKSKQFSGYNLGHMDLSKPHEIEALAGAFMLVRRVAAEEVGWWDEDFFFYGEDLDFCYRLREKGWKIFFIPEFEILHYKGASGGLKRNSKNVTTATPETKKRAHDARFNAMKIFYNKHYKDKYPKVVSSLVFAGIALKKGVTRVK